MKVFYSESTERPVAVDDFSSPTTTYVRSDVVEKQREGDSGTEPYFSYKEIHYAKEEFERLQEAEHVLDMDFRLSVLEFNSI